MSPALSSEIAHELARLGAATLGETGGLPMAARIRGVWPGASVVGTAFTVQCTPGDNLAIHVAVTKAPRGSVLIVDVGTEPERGYWGEVLTTAAQAVGIAGLVIDGGVRDTAALQSHGFPVFATMISLPGASKNSPGSIGMEVRVGGMMVSTGDVIVGDADGVTVVPVGSLDAALSAGRARENKESRLFEELRAGANTVDLLGLDPTLIREA